MKLARLTALAAVLVALAAPALSASAAEAQADLGCYCTCSPGNSIDNSELGKWIQGTLSSCTVPTSDTVIGVVGGPGKDGQSECSDACSKKCSTVKSCVKADCWCKNGTDSQFMNQTSTQDACQQLCTGNKLTFGGWNSPPEVATAAVKCPPGGMWTAEECKAVTDSSGAAIGDWDPPSGYTKGPYCYVKEPPIKLGVSVGGLTAATLAEYISAAFKLAIGAGAVLAVVMIMVGGFRYILSAGGDGISGAKDMIKNAVVGLILTMSSYTLIQTVNPDILNLKLPRVQIVKACNVAVSCTARSDKATCEKNDPASGKRCIWNVVQSSCSDNSTFESGALGKEGGECANDGSGNFSCSDGSKCIALSQYGDRSHICSKGKQCAACLTDSDCAAAGGAGKCGDEHMCLIADPNGAPGTYLKCGGSGCTKNTDCDTGFCNGSGKCGASSQGTDCTVKGDADCATGQGYKCTDFQLSGGIVKHACCLNSNPDSCLGCSSDSFCPSTMYCMDELRYASSSKDPATRGKCMKK